MVQVFVTSCHDKEQAAPCPGRKGPGWQGRTCLLVSTERQPHSLITYAFERPTKSEIGLHSPRWVSFVSPHSEFSPSEARTGDVRLFRIGADVAY